MKKIFTVVFLLNVLILAAYAGDIVNKEYRSQFLHESSNKNYYKSQVKTASYFKRQTSAMNNLVESFRGSSVYSYDIFNNAFILCKHGDLEQDRVPHIRRAQRLLTDACRRNVVAAP